MKPSQPQQDLGKNTPSRKDIIQDPELMVTLKGLGDRKKASEAGRI